MLFFSVFFGNINYRIFFVWRRDLNMGLFDIWQLSCINHFWRISCVLKRTRWNEMRCDEMISSCHRSDHQADILVGWKMKLWTQKKWTDAGWLDWKGMLSDKWSGRRYCRCCCCIREVEEEVLVLFCSGRGRGGGGLGTSRLRLDGRGRRHGRKLHHSWWSTST